MPLIAAAGPPLALGGDSSTVVSSSPLPLSLSVWARPVNRILGQKRTYQTATIVAVGAARRVGWGRAR